MTIHEYKFVSPKFKGEIVLTYHKKYLFSVVFKLQEPLSAKQMEFLCKELPFVYFELEDRIILGGIPLERITPEATTPAMEKVKMFQEHYFQHIKIEYKKQAKDHLLISKKDVTPKLLTTYFTSSNVLFNKHHSIPNFCKFYQELCAEAAGAYQQKLTYPDYYSKKFESSLPVQELPHYWKHLRGLGLVPKKTQTGQTVDWIPEITTNGKEQTSSPTSK